MIVVYHPPDPFQPVPASRGSGAAISLVFPCGYPGLRPGFLFRMCAGAEEVQCIEEVPSPPCGRGLG